MNTGMPLIDLALEAMLALMIFGFMAPLWLPFILHIIRAIRRAWREEESK